MPRFLNTWTGEFEWHPDPTKATYAILSHLWRNPNDGGEQSYDDVCRIQAAVKKGRSPAFNTAPTEYHADGTIFSHPELSGKIKDFCRVARDAGFRLAWNDTCCIDKSSSAELSEAINSMYEWYRLSDMCYVYLADVPDGDDTGFSQSKWHTRGWTLQELIAPERVVFLTETWRFLGTKMGFAGDLQAITGIGCYILTGQATLDSVSVARRMSWAARRQTTRVEDRAYSLMGLFGVHMSPIYGEGENAFLRLQEEIVKTTPDQSIFVWGNGCTMQSVAHSNRYVVLDRHHPGLFASSPSPFGGQYPSDTTLVTPSHLAAILRLEASKDVPPIHCIFTPQGVHMRLLCLPLAGVPHFLEVFREPPVGSTCADCRRLGEVDTLALLQCQNRHGDLIALPLCRSREQGGNSHGLYVGTHVQCAKEWHSPSRIINLAKDALAEVLTHVRPTVLEVSLLRHHSYPTIPKSLQPDDFLLNLESWPGESPDEIAFEIAPHSIDALYTLGYVPSSLRVVRLEREISLKTVLAFRGREGSRTPHTIELCLFLSKVNSWDTLAWFSAKGVNVVVACCDASPSANASFTDTRHLHPVDAHRILKGTSSILDDHHDSGVSLLSPYRARSRTVVHAQYTVHADGNWEQDTRSRMVRLMRVALQPPFARSVDRDATNLWLSIDISGEYRHTRPIEPERAPDNPALELHTSCISKDCTVNDPCAQDDGAPSSTTRCQAPAGDADADTHDARCSNAALRAQIAHLMKDNADLSSTVDTLSAHMATVFARLDALAASPAGVPP